MEISQLIILLEAVESLSPGTTFTMRDNDLNTIEYKSNGNPTPSKTELVREINRLQQVKNDLIASAEVKRAQAEAKLAALGLDADDLKALGL
jgi:hypothetical protein